MSAGKWFLVLFAFCSPLQSLAQTLQSPVLQKAIELYERKQFLLSSTMALLATTEKTSTSFDQDFAAFLYASSMLQLDERDEFYLSLQHINEIKDMSVRNRMLMLGAFDGKLYDSKLSDDQKLRIDLWRNRYSKHPSIAIPTMNLAKEYESLRKPLLENSKSPVLAATMSAFIPGSGQLYCESFGSALLAMVVNGIFGWATYEFFEKDLPGPGSASAMILSITYFGNILNAAKTANQINEANHRLPEKKLQDYLLPELQIP